MILTKEDVFLKIQDYLNHEISLDQLVGWAEYAMMEKLLKN